MFCDLLQIYCKSINGENKTTKDNTDTIPTWNDFQSAEKKGHSHHFQPRGSTELLMCKAMFQTHT